MLTTLGRSTNINNGRTIIITCERKKFRKCFSYLTAEQHLHLTTNDGIKYCKQNKTSSHHFNSTEQALVTARCSSVSDCCNIRVLPISVWTLYRHLASRLCYLSFCSLEFYLTQIVCKLNYSFTFFSLQSGIEIGDPDGQLDPQVFPDDLWFLEKTPHPPSNVQYTTRQLL